MKRKIRIIVILFILSFSFSVNADTFFDISCKTTTINDSITCEGVIMSDDITISDVDLEYETNLSVSFKEVSGINLTKSGNKLTLHANPSFTLSDLDRKTLFQIVLSSNDTSNDKESFTIKNIKVNNSSQEMVEDISETFNVTRTEIVLDSVNTLDSITINNKKIDGFDKNKLEYSVNVTEENLYFDATRTSSKSSVEGLGADIVRNGESIVHKITVKAENGDTRVYKISITNTNTKIDPNDISKDNTLKKLELFYKNELIDFEYDNTEDTFDIKVDGNVDKITIKAETNDTKATFANKYGPRDVTLKYGDNKVVIKVYAENNTSKVYTLNITRTDERDSDNTLNSLKINGKEVNLSDIDNYEIILVGDMLKTEIEAIANSSKAKVKYEDINLADGDNDVLISVTAENGETKEYHVNVRLADEEEKNIFEKIEVVGYDINFSKDKHEYTLKINQDTDELTINVIPKKISFEVLNNKKLHQGSRVIIKLTDDDGEHEYIINIEKDSTLINIVCYSVFAIGVVLLATSIVRYIVIKKKNK